MKKNLLLSIFACMALVACDSNKEVTSSIEEVSSSEEIKAHDGLTEETAFTIDELLEFMKDYQDKQISDKQYFVTGEIVSSTYSSSTSSYTCYFVNHGEKDEVPVHIYSGKLAEDIFASYTIADALKGATVVVRGYLELFSGKYEIAYLSAKYSPTGKEVSPTIYKITGGTPDTKEALEEEARKKEEEKAKAGEAIGGTNTQLTAWASEPSGLQSVVFDFSAGQIDDFSTINEYNFASASVLGKPANEYFSTSYARWASKDNKEVAYLANTTAIPGTIYKVEVEIVTAIQASSVSTLCPYVIDLGTSALSASQATNGGFGSSGYTFTVYAKEGETCSYFAVSTIKGVSSSGKATWYNGAIAKITVTYIPAN